MNGCITLSNGTTFEGEWVSENQFGTGEVVFFTGMTGYEQVLTDPSYQGQIVVFSYPFIGNYGFHMDSMESKKVQVAGVIMAECFPIQKMDGGYSIIDCLNKYQIPALTGVDTRALIQEIRSEGSLPAVMHIGKADHESLELEEKWPETSLITQGEGHTHIVLVDFGHKKSIAESLIKEGCRVTIVPYHLELNEIERLKPEGVVFSNGPGDPKRFFAYFHRYKNLATRYPVFGICLGHQILALAFGGETTKLKFGHRGANQPVINKKTGKVSMSSQNHSYVVKDDSLRSTGFEVWFENINDKSIEGLWHREYDVSSVQFHPEAGPGPRENKAIMQQFIERVKHKEKVKNYA
jgi:carbamoyl-phosphate synthase small subunit